MRPMVMTAWVRTSAALLACLLLAACSSEGESDVRGDCTSHYDPVASAPTWQGLKAEMLANEEWGRVASLRTQARGADAASGSSGDEDVVRVMDLLNRKGKRLVQVDVWRADGRWRAGAWSQCID